jgi:hypothetical protein
MLWWAPSAEGDGDIVARKGSDDTERRGGEASRLSIFSVVAVEREDRGPEGNTQEQLHPHRLCIGRALFPSCPVMRVDAV